MKRTEIKPLKNHAKTNGSGISRMVIFNAQESFSSGLRVSPVHESLIIGLWPLICYEKLTIECICYPELAAPFGNNIVPKFDTVENLLTGLISDKKLRQFLKWIVSRKIWIDYFRSFQRLRGIPGDFGPDGIQAGLSLSKHFQLMNVSLFVNFV